MSLAPEWAPDRELGSEGRCRDQITNRNPVFLDKRTNRKGPVELAECGEDKKEETRQEHPGLWMYCTTLRLTRQSRWHTSS